MYCSFVVFKYLFFQKDALFTYVIFFNLARQLTVQMMQNPQILAALQERLDGLVGTSTGYIERYGIYSVRAEWYKWFFYFLNSIVCSISSRKLLWCSDRRKTNIVGLSVVHLGIEECLFRPL